MLSGTKTWVAPRGTVHPEITINLLQDGKEIKEVKLANGETTYEFANLDKYDLTDGHVYSYTVTEDPVIGYTIKVDGYNITNTIAQEYIEINGTKTWEDNDNQDGKRPEDLDITLYQNNEVYGNAFTTNELKQWKYSFKNLPRYDANGQEYTYTINEEDLAQLGYTKRIIDPVTTTLNGNRVITIDIINTREIEKTTKTVTKTWEDNNNQDGIRPQSITVQLYAGTEKYGEPVILPQNGKWEYTWENLEKNSNGKEIIYTVSEQALSGYTPSYSEDTFTITNTHTPETIDKTVKKVWNDNENQDGIRPQSITVQLYTGTEKYGDPITLPQNDKWEYTWKGLSKYSAGNAITYTVEEISAISGYTTTYSQDTFTITNTHAPEKISKTVTKVWNDGNSETRPSSVAVQLYAGTATHGNPVTLSNNNGWTYTWNDLDKFKSGSEIVYSVEEIDVPTGYTAIKETTSDGKLKITNAMPLINLSKTVSTQTTTIGTELEYTITLENIGLVDGIVKNVVDELPEGITYKEGQSLTNNGTYNEETRKITWPEITVAKNSTVTLKFKAIVSSNQIGLDIINKVTAEGTTNITDEVTTEVSEIKVNAEEWKEGQKGTEANVILIMDLSGSMNKPLANTAYSNSSYSSNHVAPIHAQDTRLAGAKVAANNFIEGLFSDNKTSNSTVSVVTFNAKEAGTKEVNKIENKCPQTTHPHKNQKCVMATDGNYYIPTNITINTGTKKLINNVSNSTNYSNLTTAVNNIYIGNTVMSIGTYMIPSFAVAESLINENMHNIVIILSDGEPTDVKISSDDNKNKTAASTAISSLASKADIYAIGFGEEAANKDGKSYKVLKELVGSDESKVLTSETQAELIENFKTITSQMQTAKEVITKEGIVTVNTTKEISFSSTYKFTIEYDGTEIISYDDVSDFATNYENHFVTYNSTTKVITWDVNKYNAKNGTNIKNNITIKYYIPRD